MAKATIPVSVAGIEFDALISSDHKLEATVPEYATENGFSVSDAIILGQETLSMVLYLTDTPVTWYNKHGANNGRVKSVCSKMEELYYSATPVKIVTSDRTYTDMVIESLTISKSIDEGYAREIPISFRKIRTTSTKTTTIPSEYGKAGTSNQPAGTANTGGGSTGGSTGGGGSSGGGGISGGGGTSGGGGGGSSSGGDSGDKSSILYGIGSGLGIF